MLGESVVAVAIAISGANWHFSSAAAAVLGFSAVAAVWWLYFDRQASVVLQGSTMSIVVYSYAHIPLLMGLAAMSAGLRLLIERAGADHLGAGPSVALLGGVLLYLAGLIGTRTVVVHGRRRLGISIKLAVGTIILGLLAAESVLPPLALAAPLQSSFARSSTWSGRWSILQPFSVAGSFAAFLQNRVVTSSSPRQGRVPRRTGGAPVGGACR